MLYLCEKAVQSRRIRLSSGLGIEEGRVLANRRVDCSAAWRARAPCRTAVPVDDFWGGVPHTFSATVAALTRPTFLTHTHSTHQKIEKMFEQEIEVEDINASDSKGRSSTHKPKYPRLTPAHVGP
jgi:hypothetical protein